MQHERKAKYVARILCKEIHLQQEKARIDTFTTRESQNKYIYNKRTQEEIHLQQEKARGGTFTTRECKHIYIYSKRNQE